MDVRPQQAAEPPTDRTGTAGGPPVSAKTVSAMADMPVGVRPCSMAAALQVVGERWSLLALREMSYGVHRFARIAGYTGAPRDILADRLRKLEAAGVIERRQYSERPPRHEYHLTQAGLELFPVMIGLLQWGDRWAVDAPAVAFRHDCGHVLRIESGCAHCAGGVTPGSLTPLAPDPRP
ncbi:winged helix-turn-helix transcriptional regulator [Streptomyces sp. NPDC001068]|uniref:winged helix-turn-helix transcriptional regulator n=1 Tax=Streptomyces sp. NPDC001068 TaxID=3364544 RepID=UPI003688033D